MNQIEASQFDLDKKHLKDFGGKWNFGASFTHNVSFFYCIFGIFFTKATTGIFFFFTSLRAIFSL